jgi:hypothetical protein
MTAANKRYSYSRVAVIRNAFHACPRMPGVRFLQVVLRCGNLSWVIDIFQQGHYSWEKGLPTQSTARRLTDPWVRTQFLSRANLQAVGAQPSICQQQATRLTRPRSPACDLDIQYLLVGPNPSVINRHRWGLQPWRCQLSTHHSPTFPTGNPPLFT